MYEFLWFWTRWLCKPTQRPLLRKIHKNSQNVRLFRQKLQRCLNDLEKFEKKPREKRDERDAEKEDLLMKDYFTNEKALKEAEVVLDGLLKQAKKQRFPRFALFLARA